MPPVFSSRWQVAGLAALLALLLVSPLLLARSGALDRSTVYPAIPLKYGPFPWAQQKIFVGTNDVDIAFLGSSHIWCGINAPHVQQQLSEKLGHPARVFTLGWPWPGNDALYFIARDLVEHRRVKMLVIYDENFSGNAPHPQASRWFRWDEHADVTAGLPLAGQASLYGSAVLGVPRALLSLVRPNLMDDPASPRPNFWDSTYHAANFATQLGSLRAPLGYNRSKFFVYEPAPQATPADAVVYSPSTRDAFKFTGRMPAPYQMHFLRQTAELCRQHGVRLVVLHLPDMRERTQATIPERLPWPKLLGDSVSLVGLPGDKLFAGVSADDVPRFFFNKNHLNANGQDRFTALITPALLDLYATTTP